ncbi:A49-like RNA polymerase I associated factor-domain-containing protein [Ochromonadaceae sp. CCMP2298]|nr:A49-like RNA polymerase I associated factor-domain-containing protein [Ochromonadaceae sp. CCMP2298]|mmetsp:Transcript_7118/g.16426  ORF Transcript_7118/g.16426 Transcript_7118/m.16426 type:complete len:209 (-) Transcript_7118:341-967(-)
MTEAKVVSVSALVQDFPLLVSFPQGLPPHHEDMQIAVGRKPSGKTPKTQLASTLERVRYKGSDYGDSARKNDSCKYIVGVYDERTKKLRLVKTEHIFVMRPQFEDKSSAPRINDMDYNTRRSTLTEEFGSRKRKRALAQEKSNAILTENISGAQSMQTMMTPSPAVTAQGEKGKGKASRKSDGALGLGGAGAKGAKAGAQTAVKNARK